MSTHEFSLSFTLIECDDCGAEHAIGVRCDGCGAEARKDSQVEARRAIVEEAFRTLDNGAAEGGDVGVSLDSFDRMSEWLGKFMDACVLAAEADPAAESTLNELVNRLVQWEADLAASQRLRPFIWYWDALATHYRQLRCVAEHYFASLLAADPALAADHGQSAQEALDEAAASAEAVHQKIERWHELTDAGESDDPVAVLLALAAITARQRAGVDILDRDPYADELFRRVTGSSNCPLDLAPGLRATEIQVEMIVDESRFWECAAIAYRRLTGRQSGGAGGFGGLAALESWRGDLAEVQSELLEAGFELRQAINVDRERTQARALIRFGHILAERCAPVLVATLLSAFRDRDYEALRHRGIGDLLSQAEDVGLEGLLYGIDRALRHGDAHGRLFEIEEEGVRFSADRREYEFLTFDELLNRVLGGFESLVAMLVGVSCAAATVDSASALDPLEHLDIDLGDQIRLALAMVGLEVRTVQTEGPSVRVEACTSEEGARFRVVGMIAPYLDGDEELNVELTLPDSSITWEGPAEPLVSFIKEPADIPSELAMIQVLGSWKQDGSQMLSGAQVEKGLAVIALRELAESDSHPDRIRIIRAVRSSARDIDQPRLSHLLGRIERELLRMLREQGDESRWQSLIDELTSTAAQEVAEVRLV